MLLIKKKVIVVFSLIVILFQTIFPIVCSYATEEVENFTEEIEIIENEESIEDKVIEEIDTDEEKQDTIEDEKEITNNEEEEEIEKVEDTEDKGENSTNNMKEELPEQEETTNKKESLEDVKVIEEEEIIESEEDDELEIIETEENEIMLMSAGDIYVGNEAEFRNALAMQADVIHVRQSIDFGSTVYINYPVKVIDESDDNAMRYANGGNFFVIQNGGSLVIDGMVVDTNSSGVGGMTAINIEAGGSCTFVNSSILDGGLKNTGILVNSGASLLLWSSHIIRCGTGINLQGNGSLVFANQDGRQNKLYWNSTALFIDNFSGTCNLNQDSICMYENSNCGIYIGGSSGTVNISAGSYYNNTYAVHNCSGTTNVSGGDFYSNGWAIWVGGDLNLSGGSIHNNTIGVLTDEANIGSFRMIGGSIYSNTEHAIQHQKGNDGGCTITGGAISGDVYLEKNDNYVNTDASYPSFIVTPSTYWFKRKLVKTNSNDYANNEISKVTLTPNGNWYKYVENGSQYIVLWTGGNVIVRCKDYEGNILKQETMNGTIGTAYSVTAPVISGYDLISTPSNATGTYTQNDIIVELKYDIVNVAKVNFQDLLSGVVSAKYWYNANSETFSGNGTDFADGTIFESYGFYKVTVINGVGLEKTITFVLNKDSIKR